MATVQEFLEALFSPDLGGSFIEVRLIGSGNVKPNYFDSIAGLINSLPDLKKWQGGCNVYFGVCPRNRRNGTKDAVKVVRCLWADLDAKDLQGGKPEALKRLQEFICAPSIIVDSGHGYHAYWLLREPLSTARPDEVVNIEGHLKGLSDALGADRSAAEVARVLRLPETLNVKDSTAPVPVSIVLFEPERRYNLLDFDTHLPMQPPNPSPTKNSSGWMAEAIRDLHEGNRNTTFSRLVGRLIRDRWSLEDILALLAPHAEACGFPEGELHKQVDDHFRRYNSNSSPSLPLNGGETETELEPLEALPLSTFLEHAPMEISWSVENILPREGAGIIAGPAGYGKSWMLSDLAVEHARGGKWLGQFQTTQGRVLYLDEESSPSLLSHRLRKLLAAKGIGADQLELHLAVGQGLCFSDLTSAEQLRKLMAELHPALVIVDSLIRVHRAEENSASEMAQVFRIVKDLIREFGCAFLFADHQRKPNHFSTSLDLLLRGSSEKLAFVDSLLSLQRKEDTLIVEHSKSRFAESVPAFIVRIEDTEEGGTTVVYGGEAEEIKQAARQEAARKFLAFALKDGDWIARKSLVEQAREVGISEKALDEAFKALDGFNIERENRKPEAGRGGKAAYYRWNPFPSVPTNSRETETNATTFPFSDGEMEMGTESVEV